MKEKSYVQCKKKIFNCAFLFFRKSSKIYLYETFTLCIGVAFNEAKDPTLINLNENPFNCELKRISTDHHDSKENSKVMY